MRGLTVLLMLFLLSANLHAQPATPEPILTLGRGEIVSAAWAPDGQSIWISTTAGTWQLDTTLREIAAYPHITYAALSPDGTKLAGVSDDGFVAMWDTTQLDQKIWKQRNPDGEYPHFSWSRDSKYLAYAMSRSSTLFVVGFYFMCCESNYAAIAQHPIDAKFLTWSTSNRYLAGYSRQEQRIFVFDLTTKAEVPLESVGGILDFGSTTLAWVDDTELHWNSHGEGSRQVRWLIPSGVASELAGNPCGYRGCAYSTNGRLVAGADPKELSVLDLQTATRRFQYKTQMTNPFSVSDNPEDTEGLTRVSNPAWNHDESRLVISVEDPLNHHIQAVVALTEAGNTLWKQGDISFQPQQMYWSADNAQILAVGHSRLAILDSLTGAINGRSDTFKTIDAVAIDTQGKHIASSDTFGDVTVTEAKSKHQVTIDGTSFPNAQLVWQPHGSILAIRDRRGYRDRGNVRLWDRTKPEVIQPLLTGDNYAMTRTGAGAVGWNCAGSALAVDWEFNIFVFGSEPDSVVVHGPTAFGITRQVFLVPLTLGFPARCASNEHEVNLIDLDSGRTGWLFIRITPGGQYRHLYWLTREERGSWYTGPLLYRTGNTFDSPTVELTEIGSSTRDGWISPLATQVAAIDDSGSGLIWDATTGQPLDFLADVHELVWTPDDSTLAILRRDGSLWLQNADGLRRLWSPAIPIRAPGTLVWSGDGSTLAHVQDGVLRVWRP